MIEKDQTLTAGGLDTDTTVSGVFPVMVGLRRLEMEQPASLVITPIPVLLRLKREH